MIAIADVKEERSPGRAPRIPLLSAFVMLTRFELGRYHGLVKLTFSCCAVEETLKKKN